MQIASLNTKTVQQCSSARRGRDTRHDTGRSDRGRGIRVRGSLLSALLVRSLERSGFGPLLRHCVRNSQLLRRFTAYVELPLTRRGIIPDAQYLLEGHALIFFSHGSRPSFECHHQPSIKSKLGLHLLQTSTGNSGGGSDRLRNATAVPTNKQIITQRQGFPGGMRRPAAGVIRNLLGGRE